MRDPVGPRVLFLQAGRVILDRAVLYLEESGCHVERQPAVSDSIVNPSIRNSDLIVVELSDPAFSPTSILAEIRSAKIKVPILFVAASQFQDKGVNFLGEEGVDFLVHPFSDQTLLFRIQKAVEGKRILDKVHKLQQEIRFRRNQDYIIGSSLKIQTLLGQILKVAGADLSVLISGETGTGKELVANAVHYNSPRADHPFVVINCAAIPGDLIENELFGHMKGGFTGADRSVKGLYEAAHGGTIFLDEIGELPVSVQSKLLRVIESGEFYKIGGSRIVRVDVRTLAATQRSLKDEMARGRFREDLYYRLNGFPIQVPSLREHREDIPLLVNHFLKRFKTELDITAMEFSPSAIQKLMFYEWPGNVRELGNNIRQALINSTRPLIYREDIVFDVLSRKPSLKSFKESKREFEESYVSNILRITQGNVAEASRLAQKNRKDFYDLMRKHQINPDDFRQS